MKLVLATNNKGKVKELAELLKPCGYQVVSIGEFPGFTEVEEDGNTFADNAIKKALAAAEFTGELALADDSGLEVDALKGAPGVYSARFAGEPKDDTANNAKLLSLLEGVPQDHRTARFRCVIAIAEPNGRIHTAEGSCEGVILRELKGEGGFGYDPLFYVPEYKQTFAELDMEKKNSISHRGKALKKAMEILNRLYIHQEV
ncbi:non-canonical purine NTP pyrophosphatase, rdgB/HAM1 family [Desulforamulus reducens MI-1]|uniref:dITP/XTP pyrophosphatase n=1 Tax=Desulforamulus reducens (strain ATCC BAA-1160 / DSM 100696 / MI-1) TaxID=349161 RepID=IXTPA_DESRM|nr:XTP/dITP diphosphatase [Desulforamulus reducens]A4J7Y6.1 RecName: Full=dITP/XTP pyrophosphatase; AltName: Full=Non-canonical purine NTP pyrophosphatase; AltName: Full=Non-standard purine NTP pyrophosphatase; AltName: Full=Nucleoside-triphosphate diphosphatase; AltName: Full=Nucleoside-triphosphate pyrophosphatase; Short=NTPase [Desulforamulus reducens MI-1]ABO51189.1 non-canonical purine NTP pyrophosphatase, rdgB/HAM1 family [Desulforamulus reducens MI-1]